MGKDPTDLGRWCWTLFGGRGEHQCRVVMAYRPCEPTNKREINTVNIQHVNYLRKQGDLRTPRQAILEDLFKDLSKWKEEGDSLLVFIDANEDIRWGSVHDMFAGLDMKDLILHKHAALSPPPCNT